MPTRRAFLGQVLGAAIVVSGAAACGDTSTTGTTGSTSGGAAPQGTVKGAAAITQVFGDGVKLTAVAIEFAKAVDGSKLSMSTFRVDERTVTKVYANAEANLADTGTNGPYVIVELSPDDATAALHTAPGAPSSGAASGAPASGTPSGGPTVGEGGSWTVKPATASLTQTGAVTTIDGSTYPANSTVLTTGRVVNLIVDDFKQFSFSDPATAQTLQYNLFIPKNYDKAKSYPLVLFMHDASVVGAPTQGPLLQGLGAVCWAGPQDQAKHECFVLAPQYPTVIIDDNYHPSPLFDATVNLVNSMTTQYTIDKHRMFATGQSMGAMMALGMNIRHPDLFAASYIVAGQWPADQAGPLAKKKLWITVSQGDDKAYPGENAITAIAEQAGTKVARAVWDARSTAEQFATDVKTMEAEGARINYAAFAKGTLLPAGSSAAGGEHNATWRVAYSIPEIRDWILTRSG